MKFTKILSLILAALMLFALVSCGAKENDTKDTTSDTKADTVAQTEAETESSGKGLCPGTYADRKAV